MTLLYLLLEQFLNRLLSLYIFNLGTFELNEGGQKTPQSLKKSSQEKNGNEKKE